MDELEICNHCNDSMNDCNARTKLWQEKQLLVTCGIHLKDHEGKTIVKMEQDIKCAMKDCHEDGVCLVRK